MHATETAEAVALQRHHKRSTGACQKHPADTLLIAELRQAWNHLSQACQALDNAPDMSHTSTLSIREILFMAGFPSGQRGQTVNLLAQPSKVRILLPPPLLITKPPKDPITQGIYNLRIS